MYVGDQSITGGPESTQATMKSTLAPIRNAQASSTLAGTRRAVAVACRMLPIEAHVSAASVIAAPSGTSPPAGAWRVSLIINSTIPANAISEPTMNPRETGAPRKIRPMIALGPISSANTTATNPDVRCVSAR